MADQDSTRKVLDLRAQANATRAAADNVDGQTQDLALAAAATLESMARSQLRKARDEPPILELAPNASATELRQARQRRAVRRGQDVYLPSWREAAVGLPNLFLRSALFSASTAGAPLFEAPIAAQGDTVITMTGLQLSDYDRRVFAACLNYYREDRPLSSRDDQPWVKVSFWQLAKDLGVAYGANVHKAIRESLVRLNAAHLRIRIKRQDIPMPRLIDVTFDDGYQGRGTPSKLLRGSDLVAFRVLESMANLFGPTDWSSVNEAAIHDGSGLLAWLAGFYSTHAKAYSVKINDLLNYSGSACDLREFHRRLKTALVKLQSEKTPPDFRVADFDWSKAEVKVNLVRWEKT